jgi:hypothetical protein
MGFSCVFSHLSCHCPRNQWFVGGQFMFHQYTSTMANNDAILALYRLFYFTKNTSWKMVVFWSVRKNQRYWGETTTLRMLNIISINIKGVKNIHFAYILPFFLFQKSLEYSKIFGISLFDIPKLWKIMGFSYVFSHLSCHCPQNQWFVGGQITNYALSYHHISNGVMKVHCRLFN